MLEGVRGPGIADLASTSRNYLYTSHPKAGSSKWHTLTYTSTSTHTQSRYPLLRLEGTGNTSTQPVNHCPLKIVHAELHRCLRAFADMLSRFFVGYTNSEPPTLPLLLVCYKLWDPAFDTLTVVDGSIPCLECDS